MCDLLVDTSHRKVENHFEWFTVINTFCSNSLFESFISALFFKNKTTEERIKFQRWYIDYLKISIALARY